MAPAGAPAHRRPCVNCARQSPPLVHVRVYIHIDIHILANSSRLDTRRHGLWLSPVPTPVRSGVSRRVGRAAVVIPTGGRIATGRAEPRSGEGGGAKAEAGNMEGDGGTGRRAAKRKRAVNRARALSCASARICVSRCQDHSTPCLSAARASRGDRGYRMSRLLLASELLWVGVASEPLALRSVGDGVSALQRCVTGCSRAQRCPAHMLKDMDPITGQMQSSQRHSRLARRLQYAEARRVSSRNGL